jgi:protein TonB
MSYRALLFCPDEKAARTVTQVLGELEFTVEPCLEPFAAVKKLMGEHFDAVVVDCDNEQNATLLFKSARNSTSNQASLAVAVVEGQAGVAKAFRIGANLVLTKPINIEQSKGTLRVARGLLRKGEPVKPGTPVPVPPAPATAAPKPAAPKPIAPLKSAAPAAPTMAATPRPPVPPAKPAPKPVPPATTHTVPAAHAPVTQNESLPSISLESPVEPQAPKLPTPLAAPTFGGGAASAPAPAREVPETHPAEIAASPAKEAEPLLDQHESSSHTAAPTAFTFGGTNVPEKSSAGNKKILLAVAAVVVVAAAAYAGWTYFQGRSTPSGSFESRISGPAATPPTAKPTNSVPNSAAPAPVTSTPSASDSQPAAATTPEAAAPRTAPEAKDITLSTNESTDSETPAKPSTSASSKPAPTKSGASPLVVKGGDIPAVHTKPVAADTPAPSMIGLATPGSSAPPLNLVGNGNESKPVLQTLHISQGVSQGLLIKKVQPVYPRNALTMHMEGAVELTATISKTGAITAVKVISGEQLLTKAAVDAVKQWKYKPYLLNGEPVEIQTQVTINFKLPN